MQRVVAVVLVWLLLSPSAGLAQVPSANDSRGIGRTPLRTLPNIPEATMAPSRGPRLTFTVSPRSSEPQSAPQRSWAGRHPVLVGAIVGAGIGGVARGKLLGLRYDTCVYDSETTGCGAASSGIGAGIGAGVGALAGLIVSLARR